MSYLQSKLVTGKNWYDSINVILVLGVLCVTFLPIFASCANLNPAASVTHGADSSSGSTKEILTNFPNATNIEVIEAKGNPNYMEWHLPDGSKCTAFASGVHFRSQTPGSLISTPYCRKA